MQQAAASPKADSDRTEVSPISSHNSSPESQRRSSRHDSIGSSMSGGSSSTPQINFLQKQKEMRDQQQQQVKVTLQTSSSSSIGSPQSPQPSTGHVIDKPPIPPRGLPPPVPQRQSSNDNSTVTLRTRLGKNSIFDHKSLTRCWEVTEISSNYLFSLSFLDAHPDANSNYSNVNNRPHSHQQSSSSDYTEMRNGSSIDSWRPSQEFKMGKSRNINECVLFLRKSSFSGVVPSSSSSSSSS